MMQYKANRTNSNHRAGSYILHLFVFINHKNNNLLFPAFKTLPQLNLFQAVDFLPDGVHLFGYLFIFTAGFTNFIPIMVVAQSGGRRKFIADWYSFQVDRKINNQLNTYFKNRILQQQLEQCSITNSVEKIKMRTFNKVYLSGTLFLAFSFVAVKGSSPKLCDLWRAIGFLNEQIIVYWMVYSARFMKKASHCILAEYKVTQD